MLSRIIHRVSCLYHGHADRLGHSDFALKQNASFAL